MMRMLTENLGWKLFSVVLATGFWWAASGQSEVATAVPAAVRYRNVPPDLEMSSDHIDRLFLKVRGPATRLVASSLAQTTLVLDLGNALKPGEQTFTITEGNLTLPPGVSLGTPNGICHQKMGTPSASPTALDHSMCSWKFGEVWLVSSQ